ncbi:hypothetical protein [Paenibacillus sp. FSL H8-0537]|uniref:type IV toxin-antitoxin system AbiEi family antitoxin domain-containing protein n=1 Tax=Paenibacillus sp. FSL H8-0537 TaxID=2921399 RepID=UPI0031010A11
MARPNRYQIMDLYKSEIEFVLQELKKNILSVSDMNSVLFSNQYKWKLPASTTTEEFLEFLVERRKILRQVVIILGGREIIRYVFTNSQLDHTEFAVSLFSNLYLSHYSAVTLHDLTNEIVKSIYVNREQSEKKGAPSAVLLQQNIDQAFLKPMRQTNNFFDFESRRIYVLNGRYTNQLGIIEKNGLRVTDLERTLIDIAVRPDYSGGVNEVLNIYRSAKGLISVNKMRMYIQKLKYIYPYHQAIGFYLELAGYNDTALKLMSNIPVEHDFYLTYNIIEKAYSNRWKLYYPRNLS